MDVSPWVRFTATGWRERDTDRRSTHRNLRHIPISDVRETEMIADPKRKPHQDDGESDKRRRQEEALDEALENTFPASDPVSVEQPTTSGRACRSWPEDLEDTCAFSKLHPSEETDWFSDATAPEIIMLLLLSSPHFTPSQSRIAALAIEQRLHTMFIFKSYVEAGGLMSYGVDFVAMHRRIAGFVGKILKGAKPADIPVEQPTKFEIVVNLRTAKAIGIELPTSTLLRANEVIE
jgi:hypothetical protein